MPAPTPCLAGIPCEIKGKILSNLDNFDDLISARLTCRSIDTAYHETHGVGLSVLSNHIPPFLLPLAAKVAEARDHRRQSLVASSPEEQPTALPPPTPLEKLPVRLLREMSSTHTTIHELAVDLVERIWQPAYDSWILEEGRHASDPGHDSAERREQEDFICRQAYDAELVVMRGQQWNYSKDDVFGRHGFCYLLDVGVYRQRTARYSLTTHICVQVRVRQSQFSAMGYECRTSQTDIGLEN